MEVCGSKTSHAGRLVIGVEPAPAPNLCQVVPPSRLDQSPWVAMPAIRRSSSGFETTSVDVPHSDSRPARLLVTLTHEPAGGAAPLKPGVSPVPIGLVESGTTHPMPKTRTRPPNPA